MMFTFQRFAGMQSSVPSDCRKKVGKSLLIGVTDCSCVPWTRNVARGASREIPGLEVRGRQSTLAASELACKTSVDRGLLDRAT